MPQDKPWKSALLRLAGAAALAGALTTWSLPAQADAGFNRFVSEFWPTARAAGISSQTYNAVFFGYAARRRHVAPDEQAVRIRQADLGLS
ncbi:hypothetical protein QW131_20420 [Roseibium salinum]|nr:hypothetical protein [Roseibium salinum]